MKKFFQRIVFSLAYKQLAEPQEVFFSLYPSSPTTLPPCCGLDFKISTRALKNTAPIFFGLIISILCKTSLGMLGAVSTAASRTHLLLVVLNLTSHSESAELLIVDFFTF